MISLGVAQIAVVGYPLNIRIESGARLQRRPLSSAVEVDVELDLELADIFLKASKLLIDVGGFILLRLQVSVQFVSDKCHDVKLGGSRGPQNMVLSNIKSTSQSDFQFYGTVRSAE